MKDALQLIVTSLVDKPKAVVIEETEEEGVVSFVISLDKEDMGKVIGKEGKVIRAIRNALKIPAIKQGKKIQISLNETPSSSS